MPEQQLLEALERGVCLGCPLVLLAEAAEHYQQNWKPEGLEDPSD